MIFTRRVTGMVSVCEIRSHRSAFCTSGSGGAAGASGGLVVVSVASWLAGAAGAPCGAATPVVGGGASAPGLTGAAAALPPVRCSALAMVLW